MTRWNCAALTLALLLPSLCLAEASLALDKLIDSTLRSHPAVLAQQAQQEAAHAEVDAARWQFFPTPTIAVEKARSGSADTAYAGDSTVSTLRLQQSLWTGGRLTAGKKRAEAGVLVSQGAFDEVRQQLALRVVLVYSEWLSAHLKIAASEKSLATHSRLRDQVTRRIEQGVSSDSDLTLAVSRLKSVTADIALQRALQETALARLAQLVGYRVDNASLAVAAPRRVDSDLQTLLERALARNPGTQKLRAQAKRQETVIAERRSELSPEIYVRAERQFGHYSFRNAAPDNRIFVGLSSRFGAGLSTLSNIEGAQAQHRAALAEVAVQDRAVSEQVMADYALASSSDARLDALVASLDAAVDVAKSYDRQFLAGRKSWLDVMNAARELAQTEAQIADIESTRIVATWRLAIFTGPSATTLESGQ
jgi:adhesin transport system outer membrane protein